jgi:hypothetical protein
MFLQDNRLRRSLIFMYDEAWRSNDLASDRSV